jgi:hypothetical protein
MSIITYGLYTEEEVKAINGLITGFLEKDFSLSSSSAKKKKFKSNDDEFQFVVIPRALKIIGPEFSIKIDSNSFTLKHNDKAVDTVISKKHNFVLEFNDVSNETPKYYKGKFKKGYDLKFYDPERVNTMNPLHRITVDNERKFNPTLFRALYPVEIFLDSIKFSDVRQSYLVDSSDRIWKFVTYKKTEGGKEMKYTHSKLMRYSKSAKPDAGDDVEIMSVKYDKLNGTSGSLTAKRKFGTKKTDILEIYVDKTKYEGEIPNVEGTIHPILSNKNFIQTVDNIVLK